jgi:hypothetical protein
MARIGSNGFVDDGSSNLTVAGAVNAGSLRPNPSTLDGTTSVTISGPGFYYVAASGSSGQGSFTGSVPSARDYPGSMLFVTDTYGVYNWLLTGSSYASGKAVFSHKSGSLQGGIAGNYGGTSMSMTPSGSVGMYSDGYRWCIMGGSGSMTLAGTNL